MLSHAKIVLPTVGTCRWRRLRSGGEGAECGLIAKLISVTSGELAVVTEEVCAACCNTFPPSERRLNPVVASVLYAAATKLVVAGGRPDCTLERARQLQQLAEKGLDLTFPDRFEITPVRATSPCFFLGNPLTPSPAGDDQQENNQEVTHVCRHPAHGHTTASACQLCRDWQAGPAYSRRLSLAELVPPPPRRCGTKVKDWAIGVTTAPRRRPTLELCLDSIVRAGWPDPRLILDGAMPIPPRYRHLPLVWREDPVGAFPAWHLALSELVLQQPEADAYVLLQDDTVLYDRDNVREYLEEVLWPGSRPGILTLFYTGFDPRPGWHPLRDGWHWGAQGFVFPPHIARQLAADGEFSAQRWRAAAQRHVPIPEALAQWVVRTGTQIWYPNPSLVQHIGNTSTIWMDAPLLGGRRAPWYAGGLETQFAAEESLSDFPEDAFPCAASHLDAYRSRCQRGLQQMRERSVVICGLCRDVRHYLPRVAARIERLGEMFGDWRLVLFENDSRDATREFLLDWRSANPRVDVIAESLGVKRFPRDRSLERTQWMAYCRNRCRAYALEHFGHFSDVIVLDMDLPGGFSFDGLAHTFGGDEWDFVGSYGIARRIDSVREPFWKQIDTWAFRPIPGRAPDQPPDNQFQISRGAPLLPVASCFGGLGVYRMECYAAAEYAGGDCEHVVLHERHRRAGFGRQFMNLNQIVLYTPF